MPLCPLHSPAVVPTIVAKAYFEKANCQRYSVYYYEYTYVHLHGMATAEQSELPQPSEGRANEEAPAQNPKWIRLSSQTISIPKLRRIWARAGAKYTMYIFYCITNRTHLDGIHTQTLAVFAMHNGVHYIRIALIQNGKRSFGFGCGIAYFFVVCWCHTTN